MIQAWTGHKSFKARNSSSGDEPGNFKGKQRSNDTHESSTDPDARLYRKGNTASELRFIGHTLNDNHHGLIASAAVTMADGYAERGAAKVMVFDAKQAAAEEAQITLKGYDAAEFIEALTKMKVLPYVAQNNGHRSSAVPDSVAKSDGYAISQQKRKLIQQGFGWVLFVGPIDQVMVRGLSKVDQLFVLTMAVYNLTRMRTLGKVRLQAAQAV